MTTNDLCYLTIGEAGIGLREKKFSATELTQACFDRIDAHDSKLHAFITLTRDLALQQAAQADRELRAGKARGPLHGIPIVLKDLYATRGIRTTCHSAVLENWIPDHDATAATRLAEAGTVLLGKVGMHEFAFGGPSVDAPFPAVRNPWNPAHIPGGSSSGSGAALAAGFCHGALGSDTGGSIRTPAAHCGIVGIKPSFGRVPRAGVKPNADSMDTVGGFGRTVADAALLASVLAGDARLRTQAPPETLRIGLVQGPDWHQAEEDVIACWERAVRALTPQAARCEDAPLPPDFADVAAVQATIQAAETAQALAFEHRHHRAQLSEALVALLDKGRAVDAETLLAQRARAERWRGEIDALFERCDVLLAPSAVDEAPEGLQFTGDPIFCRPWSLLGLPCVHLPFATGSTGLPVGLQLVGRHGDDHRLLAAAQWCMDRLA